MGLSTAAAAPLRVGLVNLMPDAALRATERQFLRLVQGVPLSRPVEVLRATLPGLDRGPAAAEALASRYVPVDALLDAQPHALIVTGTDPPRSIPRQRGDWPAYYRGVSRSLAGDGRPPVDPRDVVQDLRVIEAARTSAADHVVVTLDPPAAHVR